MRRALFVILAAVMFGVTAVLRRYDTGVAPWFAGLSILAMWVLLAFAMLTRWDGSMEQWKLIRQRGRAHFVLLQGGWWLALMSLMDPSADFASGSEITFRHWWIWLAAGILAGPVMHLWDWNQRERKFLEWEKTGPLPENRVV